MKAKLAGAATLGVFALAMIEVNAVLTVRNLPSMAELGWNSIGWYFLGLLLFFLPLSLVAAELATGWPKGGGVYAWVREAFGEQRGFISIWADWAENLVWFPTVLSFMAATLAYAFSPDLASNKLYMAVVILGVFWLVTLLNFYGDKYQGPISKVGAIAGVLLPVGVLFLLFFIQVLKGAPSAIEYHGVLPDIKASTIPFVATIVLTFAGMEMAGFHALETRNPGRDYPKAILIAALLIFFFSVGGTIAVAYTVPSHELSLASGVIQAVKVMLSQVGASWLTAPLALLLALGALAQLSTYLIGPAKAIGVAAAQGDLPPSWRTHNSFGSPVRVLLYQAAITTVFAMAFILLPSVNSAYWVLSALTSQGLIVMYLLMFAAVLKLRYTQPDTPRAFVVPGGMAGIWIVAGVALVSLVFCFVVGLFPAQAIGISKLAYIAGMLVSSLFFSVGVPMLFYKFRKKDWRAPNAQEYIDGVADDGGGGSDRRPPATATDGGAT